MPRYLFTYHAYLSWLPDRKRGYVRRHEGILPTDPDKAGHYRRNAKETPVTFDERTQCIMIDEAQTAARFQRFALYYVATDASHLHALVGWPDARTWLTLRTSLRTSLTRRLNTELGPRTWFVDGSSRKRVRDRSHFDYLIQTYLPDHPGLKWTKPPTP